MRRVLISVAAAGLTLAAGGAQAQGIVKKEPDASGLWPGEIVFVDDGSCPKGQIKMVTAAIRRNTDLVFDNAPQNDRRCIPRPPAS